MAIHAPITGAPTRAPLSPFFTLANRAAIEQEIERLIALLDVADGDCDLEPEVDRCTAGDDGCGGFYDGHGKLVWGAADDDRGRAMPIYGVDQSRGPINVHDAMRAHRAAELGLVRTASGGWRHP